MQLRIVTALACACALAPVQADAQTDAGLWRFVHPNAKALIGRDVQRIRTSHVAQEMAAQWQSMVTSMPFTLPGTDLIKTIDRVVVSSPGRNGKNPDEEPPLLIAVSGKFEPGKLRQMLLKGGSKPQAFNSVTIYRPQDKASQDLGFVILNSQTLLIGDVKSLCSAIERVERDPAAAAPGIVERARDLDVAYDFWAVLLSPPADLGGDRFPLGDVLGKLRGLEAGIAVREGLVFDLNLHAMSEPVAKEIAEQFSKLIHLASKDRENHPEWAGLDRKLKVLVEHADVHFALRFDSKDVTRMAKALDDSRSRRQQLAKAPQLPLSEPPKPPGRQVIRIEGLDDGPREIPYRPPNN